MLSQIFDNFIFLLLMGGIGRYILAPFILDLLFTEEPEPPVPTSSHPPRS